MAPLEKMGLGLYRLAFQFYADFSFDRFGSNSVNSGATGGSQSLSYVRVVSLCCLGHDCDGRRFQILRFQNALLQKAASISAVR